MKIIKGTSSSPHNYLIKNLLGEKFYDLKQTKMKAIWNDQVIAESNDIVTLEGNAYFPKDSLHQDYFVKSDHHTTCPWKGEAAYFSIKVNDQLNRDAAWYYPTPKSAAAEIKDRVAFWRGVRIVEG